MNPLSHIPGAARGLALAVTLAGTIESSPRRQIRRASSNAADWAADPARVGHARLHMERTRRRHALHPLRVWPVHVAERPPPLVTPRRGLSEPRLEAAPRPGPLRTAWRRGPALSTRETARTHFASELIRLASAAAVAYVKGSADEPLISAAPFGIG